MNWIAISDYQPPYKLPVLVYGHDIDEVYVSTYEKEEGEGPEGFSDSHGKTYNETHWMHLPETPCIDNCSCPDCSGSLVEFKG